MTTPTNEVTVGSQDRLLDTLLELEDGAAAVTTSARTGQVGAADVVLDLGGGNGAHTAGELVLDIDAVDIADDDELHRVSLELSTVSDFSADVIDAVGILEIGAAAVKTGSNKLDDLAGQRLVCPFTTLRYVNDGGAVTRKHYRYARLRIIPDGASTTPSVTLRAYLSKHLSAN